MTTVECHHSTFHSYGRLTSSEFTEYLVKYFISDFRLTVVYFLETLNFNYCKFTKSYFLRKKPYGLHYDSHLPVSF